MRSLRRGTSSTSRTSRLRSCSRVRRRDEGTGWPVGSGTQRLLAVQLEQFRNTRRLLESIERRRFLEENATWLCAFGLHQFRNCYKPQLSKGDEKDMDLSDDPIHDWVYRPIPKKLWHYTSVQAFQGIIASGNIYATDVRFLNDT